VLAPSTPAIRSSTGRLLIGLLVTLSAVAVYCLYTVQQIRGVRQLQTGIIDRNRKDSLQLIRIQNNLNALGLAMRDMLDETEDYPLLAWQAQFQRIRDDLDDALALERELAVERRTPEQQQYLADSVTQFWHAVDRMFSMALEGRERQARDDIRITLQARQAALNTAVARLLVQSNTSEEQAAAQIQLIYGRVERNLYLLVLAVFVAILATSLYLIRYNRRLFERLSMLSEQRRELAQKLINAQEESFRSISRELHDEFGQILTAVGAMLARAEKKGLPEESPFTRELREVRQVAQATLERVRSLSQSLHPVMLDEQGLETAIDWYLGVFQKQTGVAVQFEKTGDGAAVDGPAAVHVYRVLQEALNNMARHSGAPAVTVRMRFDQPEAVLEVEDHGRGIDPDAPRAGMGITAMRERAELVHGRLEFERPAAGGTLVRLTVPIQVQGSKFKVQGSTLGNLEL